MGNQFPPRRVLRIGFGLAVDEGGALWAQAAAAAAASVPISIWPPYW